MYGDGARARDGTRCQQNNIMCSRRGKKKPPCDVNCTRPTRLILGVPFRAGRRVLIIARASFTRKDTRWRRRQRSSASRSFFDYNAYLYYYRVILSLEYLCKIIILLWYLHFDRYVILFYIYFLLCTWPGAVCVESLDYIIIMRLVHTQHILYNVLLL